MTDFPAASIKTFDAASFMPETEDVSVPPADTDGGYSISRPRFTRAPRRTFTFNYVDMSDASKSALEAFWTLVRGRSNAFNWTHPATGEVINVRFGEMKLKFTRVGYGNNNRWNSDPVVITEI